MHSVRIGWAGWTALLACLISAGAFGQDAASAEEGANPLGLSLTRQHGQTFEPGKPFEVTVTISAATAGEITAMGLSEVIPPQWRMQSVTAADGTPPDVTPAPGTANTLEFAWVKMPAFPYKFTYVVTTPEGDGGDKTIAGTLEYREKGGAHNAGPFVTETRGPALKICTISLKGANSITLSVGDKWEEPGYSALDAQGHDITEKVLVNGVVDASRAGQYLLDYTVTADDGQRAEASRSVTVKKDTSKKSAQAAAGSNGAAPAPPAGPSGRELSNPIAASADSNPENKVQTATPPATGKNAGKAGGAADKPKLPDLSALRPPATPQPGDKPASQPAGSATASDTATPKASAPAAQHRAPVPAKMLESTVLKVTNAVKAGKNAGGALSTTLKQRAKTFLSVVPGVSPKVIACVAVALALLGTLAFLGWRLVYSRPVVRKRTPSPPKR